MDQHWLPTANAARLLLDGPSDPAGVLIALHGYGQLALAMVDALGAAVAGVGWALACPEGPHRFYPTGGRGAVGASWMSSHGREHDIAANRRYLQSVLEQVSQRWAERPVAVLGFSQGASQLWRLAHEHAGFALLLAIGGDIPPELHAHRAPAMPPALLLRGSDDRIYPPERQAADAAVLTQQGWDHQVATYDGGHELNKALAEQIAAALDGVVNTE